MPITLRSLQIPEFLRPLEFPVIPCDVYELRARHLYDRAKSDWLAIYADREHHENISFLTGFEPLFEDVLLLLGPENRRVLVLGSESIEYAPLAKLLNLEFRPYLSNGLMEQNHRDRNCLNEILRELGIARGCTVGLIGWKYSCAHEWVGESPMFQLPSFIVEAFKRIVVDQAAITDCTEVLLHPERGMRSVLDVYQIAVNEWGACTASEAVWRIVQGARAGDSEFLAASRMVSNKESLNAHLMLGSAKRGQPVVGLRSPTARIIGKGDSISVAVNCWGGMSSRTGLIDDKDDEYLQIAKLYFKGLTAWYETADIGVEGGRVFDAITEAMHGGNEALAQRRYMFRHNEWLNTPVHAGSIDKLSSGMPFQVNVSTSLKFGGWKPGCEDAVIFADANLREQLKVLYPTVYSRIEARRAFIFNEIGIEIKSNVLPLSSTPLCLSPFWLIPDKILVQN